MSNAAVPTIAKTDAQVSDEIDSTYVANQLHALRMHRLAPLREQGLTPAHTRTVTWVGDLQQGDGGKGAMTDRLAARHQVVVRVQGGDNAGHTTVFRGEHGADVVLKGHLLPSGMRHPGVFGILANGVLINAESLSRELDEFEGHFPGSSQRVFVSSRAHVILPLHIAVDLRQEESRKGGAIGTTKRGIGPTNVSKINRMGLRVCDLARLDLVEQRIRDNVEFFGLAETEVARNLAWVADFRDVLLSRAIDSARLINDLVETGHSVLFEGAQGPLIDLEHGIYPYVTTSPTTVHSVGSGSGFDVSRVKDRIGVLKVYQTMVGNGVFVSEDNGALGSRLRSEGNEFGTTTGRDRRCGWLDMPQARWAVEVNGFTSVVLTKLDVLDSFETVGLCVGYELDGEIVIQFGAEHSELERATPIIQYFEGWQTSTKELRSFADLPPQARAFVDAISDHLGREIAAVTVGPRDVNILLTETGLLSTALAG